MMAVEVTQGRQRKIKPSGGSRKFWVGVQMTSWAVLPKGNRLTSSDSVNGHPTESIIFIECILHRSYVRSLHVHFVLSTQLSLQLEPCESTETTYFTDLVSPSDVRSRHPTRCDSSFMAYGVGSMSSDSLRGLTTWCLEYITCTSQYGFGNQAGI